MNQTILAVLRLFMLATAFTLLRVNSGLGQSQFEDAVKQLSSDNVKGYLQPFVDGFGANMNSGLYHTAEISSLGFHVQLTVVGMGTLVGDNEKMYDAIPPSPFAQTPIQTATVFGGIGSTASGPAGLTYHFQNGQVRAAIMPSAIPQLTIGDVFGTQAIVRYMPIPDFQGFPKSTIFGIGLRHSISRYIPEFPVDLSGGIFYEKLTIGDFINATAVNFGAQVSKSFFIVTLYGGVQVETASMTLTYAYTGPGSTPDTKVSLDLDSQNRVRMTGGLSLNLVVVNLNADISIGKVTAVSAGIGLGL